jgi:hypothetical protein
MTCLITSDPRALDELHTFRDVPDCFPHLMTLLIAALIRCVR